jgi:hypothetical protein
MTDSDSFDIYGDDNSLSLSPSPSSPTQSGPKKRLRRERSSSAPPLSANSDDRDDDGASTPRGGGKKVKEEETRVEDDLVEDEDPFAEYDHHVFTHFLMSLYRWFSFSCSGCSVQFFFCILFLSCTYSISIRIYDLLYELHVGSILYPILFLSTILLQRRRFVTVNAFSIPVSRISFISCS